ncbi:hypothetical protein KP509_04G014000 [Ceratopteris richardii]|uniref:Uncharacterized protein n=1 Tax=Ceratopteris richardii TaxID=49495 RepID=A0A8T2UXG0_CERRI|nr:hypothetical protein KP509_04G014000 [Ceratopteris richardii]
MGHAGQHYVTGRTTIKCPLPSHEFRDEGRVVAVDGPVDTLLYHNLVEMIPLVESLMGQQTSRSFPRHASLVYTPTPPRESWPFKKAVDHSNKGSRASRGLLVPSKGGELRETIFWHNTENMLHGGQNSAEEISMLRFPSNQHTSIATTPCSENIQLHRHVLKLEQKLSEKECQLQATEKTAQQLHIQLNSAITRLQMQLQQKDQAIQNIQNQLFERQLEVVSLQSLMKKSEVNMQASNMKAASLEDELNGLRSQVGALLLLVQSRTPGSIEHPIFEMPPSSEALSMHEGLVIEEPILTKTHAIPTMMHRQWGSKSQMA